MTDSWFSVMLKSLIQQYQDKVITRQTDSGKPVVKVKLNKPENKGTDFASERNLYNGERMLARAL